MPKKPDTLMQSADGEILRTPPQDEVRVVLVLLHKEHPNLPNSPDIIMTNIDFGDGAGEENMQAFIENATHALEPGETLQRRTIVFSRSEILAKLRETRDLD